jgi:hypothetical protein
VRVLSNHLVEGVHLDQVKDNEGAHQGRDAPLLDHLLVGCHEVECSEVNYIPDLHLTDKWFNQPESLDARLQVNQ